MSADQLNGQPSRTAPAPNVTDEMLRFRESFNLKEHLAGRPPAAPVEPSLIHLSVAQLKMLCERAGLDVIEQNAVSQAGGRFLNLEEKYEALKIDRDGMAARLASQSVQLERSETLCGKMAAQLREQDAEIVALKRKISSPENAEPPAQETIDGNA